MIRRNALFSLLGLFKLTANAHAGTTCDRCGKEIEGRYVQYKTRTQTIEVCDHCNKTLPHCDACKLPFNPGDLLIRKGERLCTSCANHATYCTLCSNRIKGQYYKAGPKQEIYCTSCYHQYPKCKICGKPFPKNRLDPASGACASCVKQLPTCQCCGVSISGTYYEYDGLDGVYCAACHQLDKCHLCGVPLKDSYWKFADGRKICDGCNSRAVIDEMEIRRIMREVEQLIPRYLGMKVEKPYTLHVETLNDQSKWHANAAKKGQSAKSPLYGNELGLYRYKDGKSEIFLLYGLPPELIYETAAHEYAHAWQTENAIHPEQSPQIREGFAQWVAAQILKVKGYTQTLAKLEKRHDHPYGTGYQLFKRIHDNAGRNDVLEYAKKAR